MNSARVVYAQSSDIKSRTFLEYRRDMKKKAIAELEILPWLQNAVRLKFGDAKAAVVKHGGDAGVWFSRDGKISRAPDFKATFSGGESFYYEFQYAERTDLDFFDFKTSKVGKKSRGAGGRIPFADREFFYVAKPGGRYAFIAPRRIMESGEVAPVPAWGSRPAYRVPRAKFLMMLQDGGKDLTRVIGAIDAKNRALNFQHSFLAREASRLAHLLESVVDEDKLVGVAPKTLDGFYTACFLLDKLGRTPRNAGLWVVYLTSYFSERMNSFDFARFVFCLDFLYSQTSRLAENELRAAKSALARCLKYVKAAARGGGRFQTDERIAPLEEIRYVLFAVNLIEDLTQDMRHYQNAREFAPIVKIFQTLPDGMKTCQLIAQSESGDDESAAE